MCSPSNFHFRVLDCGIFQAPAHLSVKHFSCLQNLGSFEQIIRVIFTVVRIEHRYVEGSEEGV